MKVIDLFAGAGGFGLGFEISGFELVASIEKDRWACDTLQANSTDLHKVYQRDLTELNTTKRIEDLGIVSPDVIIGGPPCQGFSIAGPIKDPKDPRNSLFQYFVKWVSTMRPKVFVMENVTGILNRRNAEGTKVKSIIVDNFKRLGYQVTIWKLNAADYGVPQKRERVFFVGSLNQSINLTPPTPILNPSDYITVSQAIGDLPMIQAGEGDELLEYDTEPNSAFQKWAREESPYVFNHTSMKHTPRLVERFKFIQQGNLLKDAPAEYKVRKRNGSGILSTSEYNSNYRLLTPTSVSFTIPASFYSNFIHPFQARNITAREAARIQSFPDTYVFKGKRTQISSKLLIRQGREEENHLSQYNQIGNAVPPLLAKAIALRLQDFL